MIQVRLISLLATCCLLIGCNLAGLPPLGWSIREGGQGECRIHHEGGFSAANPANVQVESQAGSACSAVYAIDTREYASKTLVLGVQTGDYAGDVSVRLSAFEGGKTVGRETHHLTAGDVASGQLISMELPRAYDLVVVTFLSKNDARLELKGLTLAAAETSHAEGAQPQALYDEAAKLIEDHALAIGALAPGAVDAARPPRGATLWEARAAIKGLLRDLGDGHSFLSAPDVVEVADRRSHADLALATWRMYRPGIAVVHVPGFRGTDGELRDRYANSLRDALNSSVEAGAKAWIIDLSGNRGGNMWPMLRGLEPLLGSRDIGSFRFRDGTSKPWVLEHREGITAVPDLQGAPVAVVTSGRTASSGEAVAVAFRGRPLARSFGRPSAGYSTSNTTYTLGDGSKLYLTTAVFVDRNGHGDGRELVPDTVSGVPGSESGVRSAAGWLETCVQGACRE